MSSHATVRATSYVLAVPDARRTARWWVQRMGFRHMQEVERWAFVERGPLVIRLAECPDAPSPETLGDHRYFAYVELDNVDDHHHEIVARGAKPHSAILYPPTSREWGVREMAVQTPDGHRAMFAHRMSDLRWHRVAGRPAAQ